MNQFIFANESSIVFNQILQGLKRLGAQLDLFLTVQQTAARQIESEPVEEEYLVRQLLHMLYEPVNASRSHRYAGSAGVSPA